VLSGLDVIIQDEAGEERCERLNGDGPFTIGRDTDSEIWLESALVSRRHALVRCDDSRLLVRDTSTNGTLVGAEMVRQHEVQVPFGTVLQVGDFRVKMWARSALGSGQRSSGEAGRAAAFAEDLEQTPARSSVTAHGGPSARDEMAQLRREIHRQLLEHLDLAQTNAAALDDPSFRPRVLTALRQIVRGLESRLPSCTDRDALVGEMADEALGLGPLEHLLADPTVTEIMVVDENTIYVERGGRIERANARFTDDERTRAVIERIITPLGRRIDESSPLVDARLKDGSRVNAVIKPLALRGSCITIRKFAKTPMTIERLIELQTLDESMARFLTRSVMVKKNIVISGGTGSGKTTLLNVLSAAIPEHERIVTIEDAAELQLSQPHVVGLETKPANMEGKGQFTIRDLVKNALRMRPDRIVVGECRGGEALDMLQAMNTGHEGSLTTTHANSPVEAVARLETLCLMAGIALPQKAIREQIAHSVHLLVQQTRLSDGSRKIVEIAEVTGLDENGEVSLQPIFKFHRTGTGANGQVLGQCSQTGYLPSFVSEFLISKLVRPGEPCL
jgi:pilus assembly protein CpaF